MATTTAPRVMRTYRFSPETLALLDVLARHFEGRLAEADPGGSHRVSATEILERGVRQLASEQGVTAGARKRKKSGESP